MGRAEIPLVRDRIYMVGLSIALYGVGRVASCIMGLEVTVHWTYMRSASQIPLVDM